ncbi:MAG TPA: hypothetical protein VLQ93_07110, partial [Myxococcaceae bacterium]|nr:hypothetical protein [Myxococcaceae bacterium]
MSRLPVRGLLSFSAGGDIGDVDKWRLVVDQGRSIRELALLFPDLEERGFLRTPIVVGCYPATLGTFTDALSIETYLRPANLARAGKLAQMEERPVVLLGQPLPVAERLVAHLGAGWPMPTRLLLVIGGYECPAGLEARLRERLASAGVEHEVVHGYGTAEIAAGCLMGRRAPGGVVHYRLAMPGIGVESRAGRLWLSLGEVAVDTGDFAEPLTVDGHEGWRIEPSAERVAPRVREALMSWGADEWDRYTGYVAASGSGLLLQLRRGRTPRRADELSFARFEDEHGSSLLDKPRWSLAS